ncbi:MAG: transposase [Clostridiales bacterium]|nr:transposase [Clostridiales bacterium]
MFLLIPHCLECRCISLGIELLIPDRFNSCNKACCVCGSLKADLKLEDRVYICVRGNRMDKDLNAAINLEDARLIQSRLKMIHAVG